MGNYIVKRVNNSSVSVYSIQVDTIKNSTNKKFSEEELISFIELMNIKHPDIVLAQAKLESSNFNSKLFKDTNNLFGMKVPEVRNNLVVGSRNGYAVYNHWTHSVIDYALYQSSYMRGMNRQEYINYLSKNYAADPNYILNLNKIIENDRRME